jgi:hypothetical protein
MEEPKWLNIILVTLALSFIVSVLMRLLGCA